MTQAKRKTNDNLPNGHALTAMPTRSPDQFPPPIAIQGRSRGFIPAKRVLQRQSQAQGQAQAAQWHLIYTHAHQEFPLAEILLANRVTYFLPARVHIVRRSRTSRRLSLKPLFPRYLLVFGTNHLRPLIRSSRLALSLQMTPDPKLHAQLQALAIVMSHQNANPEQTAALALAPLTQGQTVRVKRPHELAGLTGQVASPSAQKTGYETGYETVYVNIDVLGQAVTLPINRDYLST